MKETRGIMGMPVVVNIVDSLATQKDVDAVFEYFKYVDEKFSCYKAGSEIMRINRGEIAPADYSDDMREVFRLSGETKRETNGFFDIWSPKKGIIDPSGLVKGWAIHNAARLIEKMGFGNFYVEAGGDIEVRGRNEEGKIWQVGIRDPFSKEVRVVKKVELRDCGIATSGAYIRGDHIYDPMRPERELHEVASITVVGPNVYEADRFATSAYAMGRDGIMFIEGLRPRGFEGYQIDRNGIATMTSGFEERVVG